MPNLTYWVIKNDWNEAHRVWMQKLQNEAAYKLMEWNLWRKKRNQNIVIQKGWNKEDYLKCLIMFEKRKED